MNIIKLDRRTLIGCAGGFAAGSLLLPIVASCTPSEKRQSAAGVRFRMDGLDTTAASVDPWLQMMALLFRLEYFSAQFYAIATSGAPAEFGSGVYPAGRVRGGRRVPFGDALLSDHAQELARDKLAHATALRDKLGAAEVMVPDIDFEMSKDGPFATIASQAALPGNPQSFDPFTDDTSFLLAAFLFEDGMAAAYRGMIDSGLAPVPPVITGNLGDAIFEGGLIRALIASKAEPGSRLALSMTAIAKFVAHLDGSDLAGALASNGDDETMSADDASGAALPITRMLSQIGAGPRLFITTHQ